MRTYPKRKYTELQRAWCERYERETTFEPLMCDYEAGNESFYEAARKSLHWFETWASDSHLRASAGWIPGDPDAWVDADTGEQRVTPRPAPHKKHPGFAKAEEAKP